MSTEVLELLEAIKFVVPIEWQDEIERVIKKAAEIRTVSVNCDDKDYAIEFGEYMAKAAERLMDVMQATLAGHDDFELRWERWRALEAAIYEFRKRANRVTE